MHEQSETIQLPDGHWINVFGGETKQAGQKLPQSRNYGSEREAVAHAKARSAQHTEGDTMALGGGLNPQAFGVGINPEKFEWLVRNVDPAQLFQAINAPGGTEVAPGGAMDMTGSAASPTGQQPQQGMDYASIFGASPQAGGGAEAMQAGMQGMQMAQPQAGPQAPPPVAAPRNPGMIDFPSAAVPRGSKPVPTLADLIGG